MTDKAIQIWFGVNKQDYLQLFLDEPKKDMKVGKYVGKYPFVNSLWYDEMYKMVKAAGMTWESEPQCLDIKIK